VALLRIEEAQAMNRAALYARVSTAEQTQENQLAALRGYMAVSAEAEGKQSKQAG
jgi:DNA invertase Pin-like site-specific DNA recombinase